MVIFQQASDPAGLCEGQNMFILLTIWFVLREYGKNSRKQATDHPWMVGRGVVP